MVSDTLGCVFGCINQEVSVKSFMINQVALYHDTIIKELSGISGLLPSYVPKGIIKQLLLETVTSERSTRSNFISPTMNLFRKTVVEKINALDTIATNSEIKSICLETAKEEEFKDDAKLRKMTFCDDWVGSLKKDFNLKSATGQLGKLRKSSCI